MLVIGFLSWWYGTGWKDTAQRISGQLESTYQNFSVATLINTIFEPWRRIITEPGTGLDAHLRAWLDNAVSRIIGAAVRLMTLLGAGLIMGVYAIVGGVILLLWPVLPLLGPAFMIWGLLP